PPFDELERILLALARPLEVLRTDGSEAIDAQTEDGVRREQPLIFTQGDIGIASHDPAESYHGKNRDQAGRTGHRRTLRPHRARLALEQRAELHFYRHRPC